jgi:hypothetical protein
MRALCSMQALCATCRPRAQPAVPPAAQPAARGARCRRMAALPTMSRCRARRHGSNPFSSTPIPPRGPMASTGLSLISKPATHLGMNRLLVYGFDDSRGVMAPGEPAGWSSRPGAGPRAISIHPDRRRIFLVNELDNTLVMLDFDPGRGTLREPDTQPGLPRGSMADYRQPAKPRAHAVPGRRELGAAAGLWCANCRARPGVPAGCGHPP